MKVHYTGRKVELTETEQKKMQRKFDKIHRVLGPRSDLEAHVILSKQRHLCEAEVTLRALRHTLVVTNSAVEPVGAIHGALEKLEKQAVRNKHKIIDTHRVGRQRDRPSAVVAETIHDVDEEISRAPVDQPSGPRPIKRSNGVAPKPMTAEGAAMELEAGGRDHISYRDADSGHVNVLLRRRDGSFELVETG